MQSIGAFLNLLSHVKPAGNNQWVSDCPCKTHKTPAKHLSIALKDNKILLTCFGSDTAEDIVTALNLTLADLFIETKGQASTPIATPPAKIIAEYVYRDEDGKELFQVVRYDPKSFRQRHKNGSGEWVWDIKDVRRVLYHLPDILIPGDETVYLVEGEKDADNLWAWGQIATTSPGGASNWHDEYADFLKGKSVCIIPDKDAPGFAYAQKAANSLEGKAATISVVVLPGSTVKDISDWLEQGNDYRLLKSMEQPVEILTRLTRLTKGEITDKSDEVDKGDKSDTTNIVDKLDTERRGRIFWRLVDEWLPLHQGEKFDLDTICRQLDVKNKDDRHHVVKKLSYEVAAENLEKSDRLYIYINKTFKSIDWVNSSPQTPYHLRWPYGIDDGSKFGFDGHVEISPGDIIVIAGVSNMGKTLFCLNFLWENMDSYPCTLMGNEYTGGKFLRRVSRMTWQNPLTEEGKSKFELIERREGWKDIIRPNNINIVDWINLEDNFYKMGAIIDGIQSKLRDGIAVISIQKTEGKSLGLGGGFSEHLASLYLVIDFERMTVRKCKEWQGHNPNGEIYKFQIVDSGTKFHDIHRVLKCKKCGGTGHFRLGDCDSCGGVGVIEA